MDNEELMEILRNFTEKQVNELPDKGKMVFYAIMDIADQRDELKDKINKAIELLGTYKHYSTPTEKQNKENEDITDKVYEILKGEKNDKL